ncbi:MAG TPA: NADPH:quinone reductase [bacterium]|nr:NADPH:quinone reductase [bacterium]
MKAIRVSEYGGPSVLKLEEVPTPPPGANQVLVRVHAAGINPVDTYLRSNTDNRGPKLPYTPGADAGGVVEAVGSGVAGFKAGDRVYVGGTATGSYAELCLCELAQVHPLPESVSCAQGAAMNVPYATAYHALFNRGHGRAGETVLVHGASGGVGIAGVQLARAGGMTVIGTAGTDRGRRLVAAQGAHHALDHTAPGYLDELMTLTSGRGVDVVLDAIGGRSFTESYRLLAPLGRLVMYGVSSIAPGERRSLLQALRTIVRMPTFKPLSLMNSNRGVFGLNLGHLWSERRQLADAMTLLLQEVSAGRLRPVVARAFPLDRAAEAHRFIQSRSNIGKVVLTTGTGD